MGVLACGLTFVAGLPFGSVLTAALCDAQARVERVDANAWVWRSASQLHATLAAPLRTRPRSLTIGDLPEDLDGFAQAVSSLFACRAPLQAAVGEPFVTPAGMLGVNLLSAGARELKAALVGLLREYGCDPPKDAGNRVHVTLGDRMAGPPGTSGVDAILKAVSGNSEQGSSETIHRVWLVHYDDRTLGHWVARTPFPLGGAAVIDGRSLAAGLRLPPP